MQNEFRILRTKFKRKPKRNSDKIIVIDIETWGLNATPGAFALGVALKDNKYYRFDTVEKMRTWLLSRQHRGYTVWGHCAGEYDYYILFGNLFDFFGSENVLLNGSNFIFAKYNLRSDNKKAEYIYFADAINLFHSHLSDLGNALGIKKLNTPYKFTNNIKTQLTERDWIYCERDCEILYKMLFKTYNILGNLKYTIGGLAMDYFKRHFLKKDIYIHPFDIEFKKGYYGGRVECYKLGKIKNGYLYDINSLYPFCAMMPMPNPTKLMKKTNITINQFYHILDNFEGIAEIEIEHKNSDYGYLPYRIDNRLVFPVGKFTGAYCFPEIRYALENDMIKIKKIKWMVYGKRIKSPLIHYVKKIYQYKKNSNNEVEIMLYKYLLNALYGKFGEYHNERQIYAKNFNIDVFKKYQQLYGNVNFKPINSNREDGYYIFENNELEALTNHTIFSIGTYITSYARVENLKWQNYFRKRGQLYYTDTDSFITNVILNENELSNDLGKLKREKKVVIQIRGCKDYKYSDGKRISEKIKGIKKSAKKINDNKYQITHIVKLKESIRRNLTTGSPIIIEKILNRKYKKGMVINNIVKPYILQN